RRGLELPDRPGHRVGLQEHQPQVHPQGGVRRVLLHQVLVDLRRPLEHPQLEVRQPQQVLPLLVLRLELVRALEVLLRLDHLPRGEQLPSLVQGMEELVFAGLPRPRHRLYPTSRSFTARRARRPARPTPARAAPPDPCTGSTARSPSARTPASPRTAAPSRPTSTPHPARRCTPRPSSPCPR